MKAVLWDGVKQLMGNLQFFDDKLYFEFDDFIHSNINLEIEYDQIDSVEIKKIYEISIGGIEIIMKNGLRNVFVVDDPLNFKELLIGKCNNFG